MTRNKKSLGLAMMGSMALWLSGVSLLQASTSEYVLAEDMHLLSVADIREGEDDYWEIAPESLRCGLVVSSVNVGGRVINKFRFPADATLRCTEENALDSAVMVVGKEVALDLNGSTVHCGFNEEVRYGVVLYGRELRLLGNGSYVEKGAVPTADDEDFGVVDGCFVSVQVGDPTTYEVKETTMEEVALSVSDKIGTLGPIRRFGHNSVQHIEVRNCVMGMDITSNYNHISYNKLHCGHLEKDPVKPDLELQRAAKSLDMPFTVGLALNGSPCTNCLAQLVATGQQIGLPEFGADGDVYGNVIEYNYAYGNDVGFYGGNLSGVIWEESEANVFYRNLAQANYNEFYSSLGHGFYIDGPNVILDSNVAIGNEGSGIVYDYTGFVPFPQYPLNKPTAIFRYNSAYSNLEYGIGAAHVSPAWATEKGGKKTNGAVFKFNRAFKNGEEDLYDQNHDCSTSYYDLNRANAWDWNRADANKVEPPCTLR